jgi:hypothetical protein
MVSKYCLVLAVALIVLTFGFAQAEVLANSGKPMRGVNPQRNYNVNKKVRYFKQLKTLNLIPLQFNYLIANTYFLNSV